MLINFLRHSSAPKKSSPKKSRSYKQLGASMVEYALLVALIALIAIPAVKGLSTATKDKFYKATEEVAGASSFQPTPPPCNGPFCG